MSYARFSNGDVYVVSSDPVSCLDCKLLDGENFNSTKLEMLTHLEAHEKAGHEIPRWAKWRLRAEVDEEEKTGKKSSFYLKPISKKFKY